MKCEATDISVEDVRLAAYILKPIIPDHFYDDLTYDKWGNIFIGNGRWLRGELFYDESVQKIIASKLPFFVDYVKYPRTHHLPWSQNIHDDDRILGMDVINSLLGQDIVITEKMDGENTTMYRDYIHARAIDSKNHESRNWVKNFWSQFANDIPEGWRICGENLYAKHSIGYEKLPSYFLGFSIWNEKNVCLSWNETLYWFELLGILPVPTLYTGAFTKQLYAYRPEARWNDCEGYVLRLTREFSYGEFRKCVGKYVRKDHVQTVKHWMYGQKMEVNQIKEINTNNDMS
jgi:hypothetical protein